MIAAIQKLFSLNALLDMVFGILVSLNSLLSQLLDASGNALKWVLSLEITTQLKVIGIAWTVIRDMVNLVFIVVFIGIAFGTIFNALGFFQGWHYRNALTPLIIAALLMNFSLAIGKTVALASNQAAKVVLGVMKSPGDTLIKIMKPNTLAMGVNAGPSVQSLLDAAYANTIKTITDAENTRFQACLKEEGSNTGTGITVRKSAAECYQEITAARFKTNPGEVFRQARVSAAAAIPKNPATSKIMLIAGSIFNALMILLLISCLLSAFVFLALRIIMVWVLLATSALAWASYAIPGNKEFWHKWWKHMIAWNLFGPLYLLSLIPGLVMLGGSAEMLLRLQAAGGNIGVSGMLIQQFFFYAFAVLIFVGGLALSLKSSFATTVAGSGVIGGWATKLGVFEEGNAALGAIGRAAGRATGVTTYGGAALDRARQTGQDLTAAARGRFPALMRTEEEARALARARFGVRGGTAEFAKLQRTRIEGEQKAIEEAQKTQLQKLQSARAQAQTDTERSALDGQIKKLKEIHAADLRRKMASGNRDTRIAAGELLMKSGKLTAQELQGLGAQYQNISPTALAGFIERRDKQLISDAEKRTYTKGKEAAEMAAVLALIADPKQANKYIDAAKKGKNKFWALEAGTSRHLIMGPDGKTPVDLDYAVREQAEQFDATDLVHAEAYYKRSGREMPTELETQYARSLLSPKRLAQMSIGASADLDQLSRIHSAANRVRTEITDNQLAVRQLTNDITKALKENRADEARTMQAKLDAARQRLDDLKRPIKNQKAKEEREAPKKEDKPEGGSGGKSKETK